MALDIIFLDDGSKKDLAAIEAYKNKFPFAKRLYTKNKGITAFKEALRLSNTSLFYIVTAGVYTFDNFNFDFKPDDYDKKYVHVWRNRFLDIDHDSDLERERVFLVSKDMIRKASDDADVMSIGEGIKFIEEEVSHKYIPPYDIIFISYDEPNADRNWELLVKQYPDAKRVDKVEGILNAHKEAAKISTTENFYVVDADSEILDTFKFGLVDSYDAKHYVHIWKSRNPLNGLEYGYGGIKLFNKKMFESIGEDIVDMSTILGDGIKLVDEVASVTRFDSSAFHTFRSAFRECAKLASGSIKNQNDVETSKRLETWCTVANGEYAKYCLKGADLGRKYGIKYANDPKLKEINDYGLLKILFQIEDTLL